MSDARGFCIPERKIIAVDPDQHRSDNEVRGTILHEMAHAAADIRGSRGHDLTFFTELERLLQQGAPISVDTAEAGKVYIYIIIYIYIYSGLVPSRFTLLKRKIDRIEAHRVKGVERQAAVGGKASEDRSGDSRCNAATRTTDSGGSAQVA